MGTLELLAVLSGTWGVLMATSPLFQLLMWVAAIAVTLRFRHGTV